MIRIAESAAPSCNCPTGNGGVDLVAVVADGPSLAVGSLDSDFRSRSSVVERRKRPNPAGIRPSCSDSSCSSAARSSGRSDPAWSCLRQIQVGPSESQPIDSDPDSSCGSMCRRGAPPS